MANPLQTLDLKPTGFQHIHEIEIAATPKKVWTSLVNVGGWFFFNPDPATHPKQSLDLTPGGKWVSTHANGNASLHAHITHIEPEKLLRMTGPIGLTHLPVTNTIIFELQPKKDGAATLLRVGLRTFGFIDAGVDERYKGAFTMLIANIKTLAEK